MQITRTHNGYHLGKEKKAAKARRYYLAHREVIKSKSRAYYFANRERLCHVSRDRWINAKSHLLSPEELIAKKIRLARNARTYYSRNRERLNAVQREKYREHIQRNLERAKKYRVTNRAMLNSKARNYYRLNRDRLRERNNLAYPSKRNWFRNYWKTPKGKELRRRSKEKRRALEKGCSIGNQRTISAWRKLWLSKRSVVCYWCRHRFPPSKCQSDHIVALSLGGNHSVENLCVSCKPCNSAKKAKSLEDWNSRILSPVLI